MSTLVYTKSVRRDSIHHFIGGASAVYTKSYVGSAVSPVCIQISYSAVVVELTTRLRADVSHDVCLSLNDVSCVACMVIHIGVWDRCGSSGHTHPIVTHYACK